MTDAQSAGNAVFLILELVREPIIVVAVVSTIMFLNWKLALIGFIGFPIAIYPLMLLGKRIMKASKKARELTAVLTDSMVQLFSGMKVVKAFQLEDVAVSDFKSTTGSIFHQNMKQVRADASGRPIIELVNGIGAVIVTLVGGLLVISKRMDSSELLTFIIAFIAIHRPVRTIGSSYNQLKYMTPGLDRMFELLDADVKEPQGNVTAKNLVQGIEIKDVSFSYGRETVLSDVSLNIEPGKVTAFVGPTGSGKTTMLDLVAGFYPPASGAVLWDGIDMREFDRKSFLQQVSYAPQTPVLFNLPVRENVRQGKPDASDADVEEVCKLAGVHDDIIKFKNGYSTLVGEAGEELSGGQRQRIALARALLKKNASVFIFDEPSSSLDVQTEAALWERVRSYLAGKTVVIVAHRLTLVRNADKIVVVLGGRIESVGPHSELMQTSPVYANLWKLHGNEQ